MVENCGAAGELIARASITKKVEVGQTRLSTRRASIGQGINLAPILAVGASSEEDSSENEGDQ